MVHGLIQMTRFYLGEPPTKLILIAITAGAILIFLVASLPLLQRDGISARDSFSFLLHPLEMLAQ